MAYLVVSPSNITIGVIDYEFIVDKESNEETLHVEMDVKPLDVASVIDLRKNLVLLSSGRHNVLLWDDTLEEPYNSRTFRECEMSVSLKGSDEVLSLDTIFNHDWWFAFESGPLKLVLHVYNVG